MGCGPKSIAEDQEEAEHRERVARFEEGKKTIFMDVDEVRRLLRCLGLADIPMSAGQHRAADLLQKAVDKLP